MILRSIYQTVSSYINTLLITFQSSCMAFNPDNSDGHLNPIRLKVILEASRVKDQEAVEVPRGSLNSLNMSISENQEEAEPFYILDIGVVISLVEKWSHHLPHVKPFYAVKRNNESALLIVLATLGANFDCASQAEIEAILGLGISPDRILYANPCKSVSHIKYAARVEYT
ncbi:ornithine decarboxylase [Ricinus communis]|uniref:ornithine decarboxylase n=1 Tax=Ricinus communis TaxID=3988 RepID=UPI00201A4C80|nr:ornithine decarboxylase [Ricinus communis]